MKHILPTVLLCLCSLSFVSAQYGWKLKENSVWNFAPLNGLDFNSGSPVPSVISSQLHSSTGESFASVADRNGQLLFYTNTDTIWDRNNNPMPNGAIGGLIGGLPDPAGSLSWNTTQGAVILPVLDNPNRFYLFALNGAVDFCNYWTPISHKMVYSVIDMTLNNGLGDVVPEMKNIPLDSALGGMMTAVPGNDCNIWLLVHDRDNPVYKAYSITATGITATPVLSTTGNFTGDYANKWGEMWPSPNRQHLVYATSVNNSTSLGLDFLGGVEVCNFDATTGVVSNAQMVTDSAMVNVVGDPNSVCFSPDNSKVYFSLLDNIYQVDLTLTNNTAIINSATMISDTALAGGNGNPSLRLGTDGKIYTPVYPPDTVGSNLQSYLACINNPDQAGAASNFVRHGVAIAPVPITASSDFQLGDGTGNNAFVVPIPADSVYQSTTVVLCSNQDSLVLHPPHHSFWYEWDNGSTDSTRTITQPGTYWVRNNTYCHYRVDTFIVKRIDVNILLGNDTTICNQEAYMLKATKNGAQYLWQDGSKDSTFKAMQSGSYWVQISNDGCVNSDTIHLSFKNMQQNILGADTALCEGAPLLYTLAPKLLPGQTLLWGTGSNMPSLTIHDTGTYWLKVTDPPCSITDTVHITSEWCDCRVMMPNAFSPNNDGLNDYFLPVLESPKCLEQGTYTINIYNRWGQRVYSGAANRKGWDGTYGGKPADVGVYNYQITYMLGKRATTHIQKGEVTLIR